MFSIHAIHDSCSYSVIYFHTSSLLLSVSAPVATMCLSPTVILSACKVIREHFCTLKVEVVKLEDDKWNTARGRKLVFSEKFMRGRRHRNPLSWTQMCPVGHFLT